MKTYLLALSTALVGTLFVAGCDKPVDPGTPKPTTTIGTEIDDSVITTKVKTAFLSEPDIKGLDFQVETRKGEVQLSGFVDSQAQVERAISVARGVTGVKQVTSNVTLKNSAASVGAIVDDGVLTARVKSALMIDPTVKSVDISVVTRKGEVQLSGFVDSQEQLTRAVELVRGIEGVRNVINEMSIKK